MPIAAGLQRFKIAPDGRLVERVFKSRGAGPHFTNIRHKKAYGLHTRLRLSLERLFASPPKSSEEAPADWDEAVTEEPPLNNTDLFIEDVEHGLMALSIADK